MLGSWDVVPVHPRGFEWSGVDVRLGEMVAEAGKQAGQRADGQTDGDFVVTLSRKSKSAADTLLAAVRKR